MASYDYHYSLSADFTGGLLNESQFIVELQANAGFAGITILDVGRYGDDVRIVVNTNLSGPQQSALDAVVAAHVAVDVSSGATVIACIIPRANRYNNTTFTRCGSIVFEGTMKSPAITSFQIVSYMDTGVTNYTFRVYDKNNKLQIATGTFTNTTEDVRVISTIANLPYQKTTLEFQVMKNGGASSKYLYIDSITIFGN